MNWNLRSNSRASTYHPPTCQVRRVEALEERAQPSATPTVDLTTAGSQGTINGAIFSQANPQPTGCGVINDFLRIQSHHSATEQGYNTDGAHQFDEKGGVFTHSIRLSDVPLVSVGGVMYREFLLGVNQDQAHPLMSLDQLQIFLGSQGNLTGYDSLARTLSGLTAIYDMNATSAGNWVELNAALTHGNGSGDMYLLIPNSNFVTTPDNPNPYVYLYSAFGSMQGANGGFEQWALPQVQQPPAVQTSSLSGFVYYDANNNGIFDTGEQGLSGVSIKLTDSTGATVATAVTDVNGFYQFIGLAPGTYTITKTSIPTGYLDGKVSVGTVNGAVDGSSAGEAINSITLAGGQNGINYNFAELHGG